MTARQGLRDRPGCDMIGCERTAEEVAVQRYVEVNGVRTWYDERGTGEPVVLLHGAIVDSRCFAGNLDALVGSFRLYLPERRGHGHTPDPGGPLSPQLMAADPQARSRPERRQSSTGESRVT